MLEIKDLSVNFGPRKVLDRVSFSLGPQRLTVLVGRNGAGKSTLFGCVNQQIPYGGAITWESGDLAKLQPRQRAKTIAILPQSLPWPQITGREMVALGRNPYLDFTGKLREADREAVETALEEAQAWDLADRYVNTLSGGEKQRIALAMILAQNTPVALLDEPTAHLDLGHEAAFLDRLLQLKNTKRKTFLLILHDLNLAVRYADERVVLDGGRVVFAGEKEICLERGVLEATFGLKRYTMTDEAGMHIFFAPKTVADIAFDC